MKKWNIEESTGYKPLTDYYDRFTKVETDTELIDTYFKENIKDLFNKAVTNEYNKIFEECKDNYKLLTEFVMVLNHKLWDWHSLGNSIYSEIYDGLWKKLTNMPVIISKATN